MDWRRPAAKGTQAPRTYASACASVHPLLAGLKEHDSIVEQTLVSRASEQKRYHLRR